MFGTLFGDLADLILPDACAGCAAERVRLAAGVCAGCAAELEALRPFRTTPSPPPPGLPPCVAVGSYAGPLRDVLLAYKERGRHRLAGPLGVLLASGVARLAARDRPVVLVPVPSTAAAARARHGDHMARLAAHTVRRLRATGWEARVSRLLHASPRPDSASLSVADRAAVAESSLRIRGRIAVPQRGSPGRSTLVVVDDIVTTGATLAAVTGRLRESNMQVSGAAVVAATRLRRKPPADLAERPPGATEKVERRGSGIPNEG